jgi:hypothetical protein
MLGLSIGLSALVFAVIYFYGSIKAVIGPLSDFWHIISIGAFIIASMYMLDIALSWLF